MNHNDFKSSLLADVFKSRLLAVALLASLAAFAGCGQTTITTTSNGNAPTNSAASTPAVSPAAQNTTTTPNTGPTEKSYTTPNRPATARDPNAPTPQIGSGGNDFSAFTQARGALAADEELKNSSVVIEVREGVATLTGAVANDAQKQKAERLVKAVQGVKGVKNQLRVSAGAPK